MALPTPAKTWQYGSINQAYTASGTVLTDNRHILRVHIKDALVGFGLMPWQVRGSSDSTAASLLAVGAGGPGTDRWSSDGALVWANAGNVHSWIVLRQDGIASHYELLLSCEGFNSQGSILTVVVSPSAGFTGGSTTARPTATDEIVLLNGATWGGVGASSSQNAKIHVLQSSDGQCTRVFVYVAGTVSTFGIFDVPQNPVTGWTSPSGSWFVAGPPTVAALYATASGSGRGPSGTMALFATAEAVNAVLLASQFAAANDIDSSFPIAPIGMASATATMRGRHANFFDLWWGLTVLSDADTYPGDGSKQFAQFGDIIVPWNGSTPLIV